MAMLGKQPYPMKAQANFRNFRWNSTLENGGLYQEYHGFFNCPHKVRITVYFKLIVYFYCKILINCVMFS